MGTKSGQQKETGAEQASAKHAQQLMTDYKQRWLPVQQQLAKTIQQSGEKDSDARALAKGKSSTDTAMQFEKAGTGLEKALTNSGVGPGSSRSNLAVTGMADDQATSTGLGALMSDQLVDDAYTQGLGALTALGRGERAMVGSGLSDQARQSSAQAANDASISLMNRQGDAQLGGQAVGFGLQQAMSPKSSVSFTKPNADGSYNNPSPVGGTGFAGGGRR